MTPAECNHPKGADRLLDLFPKSLKYSCVQYEVDGDTTGLEVAAGTRWGRTLFAEKHLEKAGSDTLMEAVQHFQQRSRASSVLQAPGSDSHDSV